MTKFEEELFNKVPCKFELTTEAEYKKSTLINHFENWHSDEEFQELLEQNAELTRENNIVNQINSKLESQIADLKSQLQQQALPVVPEFVAKWIEYVKEDGIFNALALLDKDDMPEGVNEWLFLQNNDDDINLILRAWLDGYTVEKPQLFKIIFPNSTAVLQKDGELNSFADTAYKRYLIKNAMTEQEIKSIDERYWQFAVPVEDGE